MRAWYADPVGSFLHRAPEDVVGRLATAQGLAHAGEAARQIASWQAVVGHLRHALAQAPADWMIALEYDLLRLEKRIDAVLLTDRAIVVLEFKQGATSFTPADARQVEDYALDLFDFHAASRAHPVVPVLVATDAPHAAFDPPLLWHGVTPVLRTNATGLGGLLTGIQRGVAAPRDVLDHARWLAAPYRPVPTIIDAARRIFAKNTVAEIAAARADTANLGRTTHAILRAITSARERRQHVAIFVTGVPGAGKTLCGLNVVFGSVADGKSAFLSGNVPLIAVLGSALRADAAGDDRARGRVVRRPLQGKLQNVHRFLDQHATDPTRAPPPEPVVVFDEAQRAWDQAQATRDGQRRKSRLTLSEPAHALEIMARHEEWSALVALIGNGQEINTGEAGLAEWGRVIAASGSWCAVAAPRAISAGEPAQRLADGPTAWLTLDPDLDLIVPIRGVRDDSAARWVEAVLGSDIAAARAVATSGALPVLLTRDLHAARDALRRLARGLRRAGFVRSSGAKRLRAEGFGAELNGPDETVSWFLRRWPDVRASDALEVCATEYSCQGLELDLVGLAWGGDFIRGDGGWRARNFAGTRWNEVHKPQDRTYVLNSYRVLLTRARYETIIWVPPGDDADRTRPRAEMDAIADFLLACGARPLAEAPEAVVTTGRLLV
jgi:hypothetical protein